ncbi:MAG: MFS transporter [Streptosporangiaceae bacterium]
MTSATPSATTIDRSVVRRAVGAAAMGNAMEWYDFGVYAYLATTIGAVFFPGSGTTQTIESFATIAVAFILRPVGSVFFGPLGDKFGRQRVLVTTMLLMAVASFLVGVLPSYDQVGLWAPVALLALRMLQGFSTGGEYGGAATFIAEYTPDDRRGFWCSFLEFGTTLGYTLGAAIVTALQLVLPDAAMSAWGWRVPFLLALPIGTIGLYLRMKLEDTPAFEQLDTSQMSRFPLTEIVRNAWRSILQCMGLVLVYNIIVYTVESYMPTYLSQVLHIGDTAGLLMVLGLFVLIMAVINQVGRWSDHVGRKPLLVAADVGIIVLAYPAFLLMSQGQLALTIIGLLILGALLVLMLAVMSATLPAMFHTKYRYGGLSIGYNLSTALFGGTAATVLSSVIAATGMDIFPAFYLMAAAVVSLVPILTLAETAKKPLQGSAPARLAPARPAQADYA